MGQLFNRLLKFAKSQVSTGGSNSEPKGFDESDEELKRIIDELKGTKSRGNPQNEKRDGNFKRTQGGHPGDTRLTPESAAEILSVPPDASPDQIKMAYHIKMKEFHPDRVSGLGEDVRKLAEIKSKQINLAYDYLKKLKGF
jgi:DnaJ-domain-containing protein 1